MSKPDRANPVGTGKKPGRKVHIAGLSQSDEKQSQHRTEGRKDVARTTSTVLWMGSQWRTELTLELGDTGWSLASHSGQIQSHHGLSVNSVSLV